MSLKATEILKLGFSKDIFRKNEKTNHQIGRKYLQNIYLIFKKSCSLENKEYLQLDKRTQ